MDEETRNIINLLLQLFPEELAKYSHALYADSDMFQDDKVTLVKNWLEENDYGRSISDT